MKTLIVALLAFFALTLVAAAAPSRDYLSRAQAAEVYPGKYLKYREIGPVRCWFAGRTPDKSEFKIARASAEPRATRATPSGTQRVQAVRERAAAPDDLAGLEGTLCAGPCEDLRTIDPKELRARLEAAYAAFMEYWQSFSDGRCDDRAILRTGGRWPHRKFVMGRWARTLTAFALFARRLPVFAPR